MPPIKSKDSYLRIPVTLKDAEDKRVALAVKQGMERKEGRSLSWAALIRQAIRALATVEHIKWK